MSPTSYQAAPPRFITIADAQGCVKFAGFSRERDSAFIPKAEAGAAHPLLRMLETQLQIAFIMLMDVSSCRVQTQAAVHRNPGTARESRSQGRKDFCHSEARRASPSL